MVQKTKRAVPKAALRGRGRPRAFEADIALAQAMDVFWSDGFAATSLDDISAATGLNRPSLYGAFGDKRALYLQAYGQYRKRMNEPFAPLFAAREPLRDEAHAHSDRGASISISAARTARAAASRCSAPRRKRSPIRTFTASSPRRSTGPIGRSDALFADARAAGELRRRTPIRRLARVASATIHIAVDPGARARIPRAEILPIIDDAVTTICGAGGA